MVRSDSFRNACQLTITSLSVPTISTVASAFVWTPSVCTTCIGVTRWCSWSAFVYICFIIKVNFCIYKYNKHKIHLMANNSCCWKIVVNLIFRVLNKFCSLKCLRTAYILWKKAEENLTFALTLEQLHKLWVSTNKLYVYIFIHQKRWLRATHSGMPVNSP